MKYYHKYQEALEAAGYRVDEHGYVWDSAGNQSAGEDNYGNVQSKDAMKGKSFAKYNKGGMSKKMGYNKGGYCGASNPAERPIKNNKS